MGLMSGSQACARQTLSPEVCGLFSHKCGRRGQHEQRWQHDGHPVLQVIIWTE